MIIRTDRLELRPFVAEDFIWFKEVAKDEEVEKFLPGVACGDDTMVKEAISLYSKGDFLNDFYYVICDYNNNQLGIVIATRVTSVAVDVSYFLKKEFRHQGYMREALMGFINRVRKAYASYEFRFVIAGHNIDSLNVVSNLGATVTNVMGQYICFI